jgi:energy-coupling factor transporter ATP-binding protein EcfA2
MDLRSVRVRNYKSVQDSGVFTIEPTVTCLVGKNESGKTAVLEALYRLKPVPSGHPEDFDGLRDYPRRFYGRDMAKIPTLPVIDATFELADSEVERVETKFGQGCVPSRRVTFTTGYSNRTTVSPLANEAALVERMKKDPRLAGVDLSGTVSMDDFIEAIDAVTDPPAAVTRFRASLAEPPASRYYAALGRLMPSFIYFSQYNTLPGTVSIGRLQKIDATLLEPGERTALSLLRFAGLELEQFDETNYEARKAALEAAANVLSDEIFEYWTQDTELQIELDIEFRQTEPAPSPREPFLQVRIRNNRHRVTLNLSERSAGFVWFFSFLAYFSEFRGREEKYILLLDEPGLNLHGVAQAGLLRYIEERLVPTHQVLYTTHSPFMVQARHLERTRLIEDVGQDGTAVRDDALGSSEETQFPLHAAISVDLAESQFLGSSTLIVDGNAELLYLRTVSRYMKEHRRGSLDERWSLLPVGGLEKMPTFTAFLAPQVYVVAIQGMPRTVPQRLQSLLDRKIISSKQLISLSDITGSKEAGIEDMLDEDLYLRLLNESGFGPLGARDLVGSGSVSARVQRTIGRPYSRYAVARHLAFHPDAFLSSMSAISTERFKKLFRIVNDLLPSA